MRIEYRQVLPPHGYKPLQMIDETERLRYFKQSEQTRGGIRPDYRDVPETEQSFPLMALK